MNGHIALFLTSFTSATVLPGASELAFLMHYKANQWAILSLAIATIGNTLGGLTSFAIGHLGRIKWFRYLGVSEQKTAQWANFVVKNQKVAAFLTWLPIVGDVWAVALGLFRCRPITVALFMLVGKGLRYGAVLWAYGQ